MNLKLGIGEYGVIGDPGQGISTHALGSCVSLIIQDRAAQVVGMVHVALPDSSLNSERAAKLPGYFADTGVQVLEENMRAAGALESRESLRISLVGGASVLATNNSFNIGLRNLEALKTQLAQRGWDIFSADTGGTISRTVEVQRDDGMVLVSSPGVTPKTIEGVRHG